LLTDGHLNAGITKPDHVEALTRAGLEKDEIRTSCLEFGDSYNENILVAMSCPCCGAGAMSFTAKLKR